MKRSLFKQKEEYKTVTEHYVEQIAQDLHKGM